MSSEEILPGDIVAVHHGGIKKEGIVVGSSYDYAGRQMVEVQLDGEAPVPYWYPSVTRVKRTISYTRPTLPQQRRSVERYIYW